MREIERAVSGLARRSGRRREGALRGTSRTKSSCSIRPRARSASTRRGERVHRPLPRPAPPELAPIKALKLTGLAGAYWRGDEKNKQLTRIYGTAFYSQADLDAHLARLEEARKRDHRRLGVQLDLFHLSEHSPGSPFWHPKGMVIWNTLEDLRRRENVRRGYVEVKTPILYDQSTYETSGHLANYEENIFLVQSTRSTTAASR